MKKAVSIFLAMAFACAYLAGCTNDGQSTSTQGIQSASVPASSYPSTSVTSSSSSIDSDIEGQALALADHIIKRSISEFDALNSTEHNTLSDLEIYAFVMTLFLYKDNESHPYYELVHVGQSDSVVAYITESDAQDMVRKVFGIENWRSASIEPDKLPDGSFGYNAPYGAGVFSSTCDYKEPVVTVTSDTEVNVDVSLFHSQAFGDNSDEYGTYRVGFELIQENGDSFLRFVRFEKLI